jgi:hypothetical protein
MGLVVAAAGFPAFHLWRRVSGGAAVADAA